MNKNRFSFNTDLHRLELDGKTLFEGESIEICVFEHWLPGYAALDPSGWYLMTHDLVGIRLLEGLAARRPLDALHVPSASNGHGIQH